MVPQTLSVPNLELLERNVRVGGDRSGRIETLNEADAVKFENCAPYIREWMEKKIEGGVY
jgi:hypothetical protein